MELDKGFHLVSRVRELARESDTDSEGGKARERERERDRGNPSPDAAGKVLLSTLPSHAETVRQPD